MRSYEAARGLFSFLAFCSWVVIIVGGIAAVGAIGALSSTSFGRDADGIQLLIAAVPGLGVSILGFYGLALVQMGRANVDSAEYGQQMLQVARDQLEVSRQALHSGLQQPATYASNAPLQPAATGAEAAPGTADEGRSYGDRQAIKVEGGAASRANELVPGEPNATLPKPAKEVSVSELVGEPVEIAGRELTLVEGTYKYGSMSFDSREQAETYFEQMGVNPNFQLRTS